MGTGYVDGKGAGLVPITANHFAGVTSYLDRMVRERAEEEVIKLQGRQAAWTFHLVG